MAATASGGRHATSDEESSDRTLASVLEARVAHLKGVATRAEDHLDDGEEPHGAAELAAAAAGHEAARRALDRVD